MSLRAELIDWLYNYRDACEKTRSEDLLVRMTAQSDLYEYEKQILEAHERATDVRGQRDKLLAACEAQEAADKAEQKAWAAEDEIAIARHQSPELPAQEHARLIALAASAVHDWESKLAIATRLRQVAITKARGEVGG